MTRPSPEKWVAPLRLRAHLGKAASVTVRTTDGDLLLVGDRPSGVVWAHALHDDRWENVGAVRRLRLDVADGTCTLVDEAGGRLVMDYPDDPQLLSHAVAAVRDVLDAAGAPHNLPDTVPRPSVPQPRIPTRGAPSVAAATEPSFHRPHGGLRSPTGGGGGGSSRSRTARRSPPRQFHSFPHAPVVGGGGGGGSAVHCADSSHGVLPRDVFDETAAWVAERPRGPPSTVEGGGRSPWLATVPSAALSSSGGSATSTDDGWTRRVVGPGGAPRREPPASQQQPSQRAALRAAKEASRVAASRMRETQAMPWLTVGPPEGVGGRVAQAESLRMGSVSFDFENTGWKED